MIYSWHLSISSCSDERLILKLYHSCSDKRLTLKLYHSCSDKRLTLKLYHTSSDERLTLTNQLWITSCGGYMPLSTSVVKTSVYPTNMLVDPVGNIRPANHSWWLEIIHEPTPNRSSWPKTAYLSNRSTMRGDLITKSYTALLIGSFRRLTRITWTRKDARTCHSQ